MPKRANCIKITEDAQTIAVGDKFGDVYSFVVLLSAYPGHRLTALRFLLDANQEVSPITTAENIKDGKDKEENKRQPVLGHVSLLTDMTFYNSPLHGQTLITADRDEHIRISKWPHGLEIVQYLLGHLKYVFVFSNLVRAVLNIG